ncbi:MAG TPA: hypothetical protein VGE72_15440 [Azospirillum sp.]
MTHTPDKDIADAMPAGAPRAGTAEFALVGLAALTVEGVCTAALLDLAPVPGGALAAALGHFALAVLLWGWVWWRVRRDRDARLAGLLAVTTPFLGPLGPACTLATAVMHAVFSRYAMGFQEWYLSLFPESQVEPAQELYELIVSGREQASVAAAESFTDVMTVGLPPQKQAVIALVARHFRPAFTPALKLGLADADPSVRVQAATATARVEHEFNERWQRLDAAAQSNPDDAESRFALARHLDEYAFCGLLDANREQEVRERALEGYRGCLDLAPDDDDIRHDLGRLLLRLGLVAEAADALAPLAGRTADRRILFWYAESLFRLHRFDDLRALCRLRADHLGPGADLPDSLRDVLGLWSAEDQPALEEAA